MYARMIKTKIMPESLEEAVQIFETAIVPSLHEQPGFKGATLLVNEEENTAVSLTYWETEAQLRASEATGHLQQALTDLALLLTSIPENDHFAVRLQV